MDGAAQVVSAILHKLNSLKPGGGDTGMTAMFNEWTGYLQQVCSLAAQPQEHAMRPPSPCANCGSDGCTRCGYRGMQRDMEISACANECAACTFSHLWHRLNLQFEGTMPGDGPWQPDWVDPGPNPHKGREGRWLPGTVLTAGNSLSTRYGVLLDLGYTYVIMETRAGAWERGYVDNDRMRAGRWQPDAAWSGPPCPTGAAAYILMGWTRR